MQAQLDFNLIFWCAGTLYANVNGNSSYFLKPKLISKANGRTVH